MKSPVAKHFNKFCKPAVLTDEKKEAKLRPKKYRISKLRSGRRL